MNRLVADPKEFLLSHRTSAIMFLDSCYQIFHTCVLQQRIMSNKTAKVLTSVTEGEQTPAAAGFLAGVIAGNLLGINSKLISRLKSISSFPAINWTTLTKTDNAGIKFDKMWAFDEVYQYLPMPSRHKPGWLLDCPLHILISNIRPSALMTINYLYCHGLHPRSSPLAIFQMHPLAHPVPKQAHDIQWWRRGHIWARNPFHIQMQHQEKQSSTPESLHGFLLMAGEMPSYKILIYLLR